MELIERDHRNMTERVIETLDISMYPDEQVGLLADMQQDIPSFPDEGIEYVVYDGEVVYAHWTGDYWKMADSYDPKAVDGWTRITGEPPEAKPYIPTDETDARLYLGSLIAQGLQTIGIECSYDNDHKDGEVVVDLPGGYTFTVSTDDFGTEVFEEDEEEG